MGEAIQAVSTEVRVLKGEANWLKSRLEGLYVEDAPLLNVGASNAAFRERHQPWIETLVFAPLRARGIAVLHQDLEDARGVDVPGDLQGPECQQAIRARGVRSILCSNVLEHVQRPEVFARILCDLLPIGGRLLVTVPRAFPFHPDPIDTMFRPSTDELLALFPGTDVLDARVVPCGRVHNLVLNNPSRLLTRIMGEKLRVQAQPSRDPAALSAWIPWVFRRFHVSCVDLVKRRPFTA